MNKDIESCKRYSFQITRDEYGRGMWYGNGDHKAVLSRLKKWEEMLCDIRMPVKLKGKVYKPLTRPAMLYGAET